MKEYFLVTWHESGDEIHFVLLDMCHYDFIITTINEAFANPRGVDGYDWEIADKITSFIHKYENGTFPNQEKNYFIQTHCNEEWPFNGYNIKRILSLPYLGY